MGNRAIQDKQYTVTEKGVFINWLITNKDGISQFLNNYDLSIGGDLWSSFKTQALAKMKE